MKVIDADCLIEDSCLESADIPTYIDYILDKLIEAYSEDKTPIQVDFRKLVYWVPYADSYTHYIHPYPAKLIKHIPIFFLNSKRMLNGTNRIVLDPFCGSGTVLLEAILHNYNAYGCDANPLATLISKVKTTSLNPELLLSVTEKIITNARRYRKYDLRNVVNVDLWFSKGTQHDLSRLLKAIEKIESQEVRDFFLVTFSSIIKKCSYSDQNMNVPVRINPDKYKSVEMQEKLREKLKLLESIDVFSVFRRQVRNNILRMEKLYEKSILHKAKIISSDAKNLSKSEVFDKEKVDFIITSPPYAGAQKYIRSSSLSLGWLGFCEDKNLRDFEKLNIGREHYSKGEYKSLANTGIRIIDEMLQSIWTINPLRAHINGNYIIEMELSIREMYNVLNKNCYCVIVMGNNKVCGLDFETQKYIQLIAEKVGFSTELVLVDDIHSRGLMTKRNKTSSVMNSEWILVFKK
ncbi:MULTISPECIES: DNA methyltransferase [Psychrobacter]|uniref:DNA methyltransferase n=1 Tax=Psychrobacter TaxID=497 RepID=UPI00191AAB27|nr:DNA methyltransferase [Psychrobacter immobilis]